MTFDDSWSRTDALNQEREEASWAHQEREAAVDWNEMSWEDRRDAGRDLGGRHIRPIDLRAIALVKEAIEVGLGKPFCPECSSQRINTYCLPAARGARMTLKSCVDCGYQFDVELDREDV